MVEFSLVKVFMTSVFSLLEEIIVIIWIDIVWGVTVYQALRVLCVLFCSILTITLQDDFHFCKWGNRDTKEFNIFPKAKKQIHGEDRVKTIWPWRRPKLESSWEFWEIHKVAWQEEKGQCSLRPFPIGQEQNILQWMWVRRWLSPSLSRNIYWYRYNKHVWYSTCVLHDFFFLAFKFNLSCSIFEVIHGG